MHLVNHRPLKSTIFLSMFSFEPPHDKTNKMACALSEESDQSSLSAWRKLGSLATHWAHSKDFDQTGKMPRLIWVFAGRTVILLVLSWGGSFFLVLFSSCFWLIVCCYWDQTGLDVWFSLFHTHLFSDVQLGGFDHENVTWNLTVKSN